MKLSVLRVPGALIFVKAQLVLRSLLDTTTTPQLMQLFCVLKENTARLAPRRTVYKHVA